MINRGAFVLRHKQPAVDWLIAALPQLNGRAVTLADLNEELTVYLVSDATVETPESFRRWLKRNYQALFEAELEGWCTDRNLWPPERSFLLFCAWFDAERHSVVVDLAGGELHDDEF